MSVEWPDWLTFRPIEKWPGDRTPEYLRERAPFSAPFSSTTSKLRTELDQLNAQRPVLQVALQDSDIRLDGKPRANARAAHPGVILAYSRKGKSRRFASAAAARNYLAQIGGVLTNAPDEVLYRAAAKHTHPDTETGSHEEFLKVKEAFRLLTANDTYQFAVDKFESWQTNLRAIALGLESLRRVNRYGMVKDDEQYAGWKQLSSGGAA